jgi:signal transduction histidine kinase
MAKDLKSLENEIFIRKYRIVRFLSFLFFASGMLALMLLLFTAFSDNQTPANISSWIISGIIVLVMFYIYKVASSKYLSISANIIIGLLLVVALINVLLYGTDVAIAYLLLVTAILTASIVISIEFARIITFLVFLVFTFVYFLHNHGFFTSYLTGESLDYINVLMLLFFTWIITNVARIGYDEIEHSYQKAVDYAKELEDLNKSLDKKVKLRTKQLEESLKRQADAVYSAAVVGSVTRPILHDISTPLSSFEMAINQLKGADEEQTKIILGLAETSLKQMVDIVENGRDLIKGNVKESYFSPAELVEVSLQILNNEINVNNINLNSKVDHSHKIWGSSNLYIRITTNLILNAIQELRDSGKEEKTIEIKSKEENGNIIIFIRDSGRGIPEDKIETIFESGFTSKEINTNLGFGLPFVKNIIEEQFKGTIEISSKLGKYSEFKMTFPSRNK